MGERASLASHHARHGDPYGKPHRPPSSPGSGRPPGRGCPIPEAAWAFRTARLPQRASCREREHLDPEAMAPLTDRELRRASWMTWVNPRFKIGTLLRRGVDRNNAN